MQKSGCGVMRNKGLFIKEGSINSKSAERLICLRLCILRVFYLG